MCRKYVKRIHRIGKHMQKKHKHILVPGWRNKDSRHILQNPKVSKNAMGFNNHAQRSTPPYYLDVDNPLHRFKMTSTSLLFPNTFLPSHHHPFLPSIYFRLPGEYFSFFCKIWTNKVFLMTPYWSFFSSEPQRIPTRAYCQYFLGKKEEEQIPAIYYLAEKAGKLSTKRFISPINSCKCWANILCYLKCYSHFVVHIMVILWCYLLVPFLLLNNIFLLPLC